MLAHGGASAPSTTWYFAAGRTDGGTLAYVPVTNPQNTTVTVTLTVLMDDGSWREEYVLVPPRTTHVFGVHHLVSSPGVSVLVHATLPVYAEESTYLAGRRGAAITAGASHPARTWYLAEGYTAGGFSETVVILNPGGQPATVRVLYATRLGQSFVHWLHVPARARLTWNVNADVPPGNVALALSSDVPVVVGRAEQFHDGWGLTMGGGLWGPAAP
jgi:hypothetical protein